MGPTRVALPESEGGIDHDSVLFCDEVCCLDEAFLDFETGPLGDTISDAILVEAAAKVARAVGLVIPLTDIEVYPDLDPYYPDE